MNSALFPSPRPFGGRGGGRFRALSQNCPNPNKNQGCNFRGGGVLRPGPVRVPMQFASSTKTLFCFVKDIMKDFGVGSLMAINSWTTMQLYSSFLKDRKFIFSLENCRNNIEKSTNFLRNLNYLSIIYRSGRVCVLNTKIQKTHPDMRNFFRHSKFLCSLAFYSYN